MSRYRWAVASRALAATFGGYALSSAIAAGVGLALARSGSSSVDAVLWATMLAFIAHAVAALVTVAALRFGERAFWGVIGTARLLLARLLVVVIPRLDVPRPVVTVERRFVPRDLDLLLSSMRHRGPPAELSA